MITDHRAAVIARPVLRSSRSRWAALVLGVMAAHVWLADKALEDHLGLGADAKVTRRIDVAFVRELQPESPLALLPLPLPRRALRAAALPAAAASAPLVAELLPEPVPELLPELPPVPAPVLAVAPVDVPPDVSKLAQTATFEWPPSTRLSYTLSGNYRGPVEGQARVEWLRSGGRYQVHLDVSVGPSFAPLLTRRMSSDGELTAAGLRPRRYDEETRALLRSPRVASIVFDDEFVRLPAGDPVPLPPGVQDTASQFVQITWMFTTQPELLEPGRTLQMPLALPRRVDLWLYDVLARETLDTPVGPIETVHVKPRREAVSGGDLTAEMWLAPTLQYLPVRILIRQDRDNYADLLIERLPQQAADAPLTTR